MKKILIFSTLVLAIVISGCGGDVSGGSPPTPSITTMDYEFTVIIDGVVNKVAGNQVALNSDYQPCQVTNYPPNAFYMLLGITDVTSSAYVQGYPFNLIAIFESNLLGEIDAKITFQPVSSFYSDKYPIGGLLGGHLVADSTIDYLDYINNSNLGTKINITDLGTKYTGSATNSYKSFKGYMNKTRLYYPTNQNNWGFIDLEMSFEAVRT